MIRTSTIEAIVLKRRDYSEADRIVTLFSKERGKLTLLAKGIRKITSKRSGSLEVGTHLKAQVIATKSMPILSQTLIINSYQNLKLDLSSITRLYQLLEVVDVLTGEDQENHEVYQILVTTLSELSAGQASKKDCLLEAFQQITERLGFSNTSPLAELNLKSRIETIADKKLHAKDFLMPDKIKS